MSSDDFLILGPLSGEAARTRRCALSWGAVQSALGQWLQRGWNAPDEIHSDELPPGAAGLCFRLDTWEPAAGDGSEAALRLRLHAESPDRAALREQLLALAQRFPDYPEPELTPGGSQVVFGRAELLKLTFSELPGPGFRRAAADAECRIRLNLAASRFSADDRLPGDGLPDAQPVLDCTPDQAEQLLRRWILTLALFPEAAVATGSELFYCGEQLSIAVTAAPVPRRSDYREFAFTLCGIAPEDETFRRRMSRLHSALTLLPLTEEALPLQLAQPTGPLEFTTFETVGSRWFRAQFPGLATIRLSRS